MQLSVVSPFCHFEDSSSSATTSFVSGLLHYSLLTTQPTTPTQANKGYFVFRRRRYFGYYGTLLLPAPTNWV